MVVHRRQVPPFEVSAFGKALLVELPAPVVSLLRDQQGLAAHGQLLALGLSRDVLRWRLGRTWRVVLPGVVAAFTGSLDGRQRLIAAQLYGGRDSMITSSTAAAWHGVTSAAGDPRVHILVPADRWPRGAAFVVVHRTRFRDPFPFHRPPLTVVSPARSVVEAARAMPTADSARAVVLEATQRGIVRVRELRHAVETGQKIGSARVRAAIQEAEAGAWSVPEADLFAVLRRSKILPQVWLNPDLLTADGTRLPRPDGWIDDAALAIQVHSRLFHSHADDWDRTVMVDGIFTEHGIPVVAVTPRQLRCDPDNVLGRIERTYLAACRRPRPDVVATPIGHSHVP